MVTAIPVSTKLTIINGKERYTNGNIKATATTNGLLGLAMALNSLQYGAPADQFIVTAKSELKTV